MKGILFKPDMIKAIVEGRKTQTRRVIKELSPDFDWEAIDAGLPLRMFKDGIGGCIFLQPRYQVSEVVYIKEAWAVKSFTPNYEEENQLLIRYKSDYAQRWITVNYETWAKYSQQKYFCWKSPLFMPAWAARYFIRILDVRPERLQEISPEGMKAEGLPSGIPSPSFANTWDSINPNYPFESNPWVWRYEFEFINKGGQV